MHLQVYLRLVHCLLTSFPKYQLINEVKAENTIADALSKLETTDHGALEGSVYLENLEEPSTMTQEVMDID